MARWDKILSRGNVEDRRGMSGGVGGIGVIGIVVVLAAAYFGGTEQALQVYDVMQGANQGSVYSSEQPEEFAGEDTYEIFASSVLGFGNDVWQKKLTERNIGYTQPRLVLFRGSTQSGCGGATSAIGPHYCPLDETIYLDETFFDEMIEWFGAQGGDVAEAYVIAHEIGHHVQHVTGSMNDVQRRQQQSPDDANALSVQQELQADCYAGVWAHELAAYQDVLEEGEIEEAMDAAAAVGDDRIQEKMQGRVHPESWTHGSSEDRKKWFKKGFVSGEFDACDTSK